MKFDDYDSSSNWSPSNIMGGLLTILGLGVLIWVVTALFQLFTSTSSFLVLDQIVPREMVISQAANGARVLLPREILIFGIPIWCPPGRLRQDNRARTMVRDLAWWAAGVLRLH